MRADRLVATLLLMQSRGRVTAREVAGELEVSLATARRDLEALSASGVPVYSQSGRGGGWTLVGGARTDLSGLTATEAQALFLLAGPAAGSAPEVRSALRKLIRALPDTFRADAEAAAEAVVVDSARWGEYGRVLPEHVEDLQRAVVRRRRVRLSYEKRDGETSERLVDPWGLVAKDKIWYLVAGTERGQRTFRLDRVMSAEITEEPAERPANFNLSAAWLDVVDEMERQRSLTSATVLIDEKFVPILQDHFGRHCGVVYSLVGGPARARVSAPTARSIAEQLAGWGSTIVVVEPDSVRQELTRIGAELVAQYADGALK